MDRRFPITLPVGVVKNDSPYAIKGRYSDTNFVRGWDGKMQKWKGWGNYLGLTTGSEPARGGRVWNTNDGVTLSAYGTASKLWLIKQGVKWDITPQGYSAGLVDRAPPDAGWGDGSWGSGPWGGGWSTAPGQTQFPRVWTLDRWGQDLVACPRGQPIYTWQYGAGNTLGITKTGTWTAPSTTIALNNTTTLTVGMRVVGTGIDSDTFIQSISSPNIVVTKPTLSNGSGTTLTFNDVARTLSSLGADSDLPTSALGIFVTDDRTLVAFGAAQNSLTYDDLNIAWCDRENYLIWTTSTTNTAGAIRCEAGNQIMTAVKVTGGWLVLTDLSSHPFIFQGGDDVFSLDRIGFQGGCIGPQAATSMDGAAYWMGFSSLYRYAGRVEQLDCDVQNYLFSDLARDQSYKIFASTNVQYGEIIWFYPSKLVRENDSYVAVNVLEQPFPWSVGRGISRTTWIDLNPLFKTPLGTDGGNFKIYQHESGTTADGDPITYLLESGEIEMASEQSLQSSRQFMRVKKVVPDYAYVSGEHFLTIDARNYPDDATPVSKGPYPLTVNGSGAMFNPKARGASFRFRMTGTGDFRLGDMQAWAAPDGGRA